MIMQIKNYLKETFHQSLNKWNYLKTVYRFNWLMKSTKDQIIPTPAISCVTTLPY